MASTSGRSSKAPRFFKVIMDPKADRLGIPIGFLERYEPDLPSSVVLKAPGGSPVEVEVGHSDGRTWLKKGWPEFRDRYSIGFGHFLVFELKNNSRFNVSVFDMTTTEINYRLADDCVGITNDCKDLNFGDLDSFTKTLNANHYYCRLTIPRGFASRTGIAKKATLILVNEHGMKWHAPVCATSDRISIARGWKSYWKENKLAVDMTLKFAYDASSSTMFVMKETSV